MTAPVFAALLKPVELRAGVDPLSGDLCPDPLSLGLSPADEAALEWALSCADLYGGRVRTLAAGDGRATTVLRAAGAAGASELVWVEIDPDWPSDWVAHSLAAQLADVELVWCGDTSFDRGSGSVPAFVADELSRPQALGLVAVELAGDLAEGARAVRRLDGGRRERLSVRGPAVLSVEGSTARLRRAPLGALLAAEAGAVPLRSVAGRAGRSPAPVVGRAKPYRPAARVVAPPEGESATERVRSLLGIGRQGARARHLSLEPAAAAAMIIESLESWGEL